MELSPMAHPQPTEMIPGIGVAGQVMCPFMSVVRMQPCLKSGCEMWVELSYGQTKVARCALTWLPVLSTELRGAIEKLKDANGPTP